MQNASVRLRKEEQMSKYIVEFSKNGTMCYISHLDMMRLFNRNFKRAGIRLAYSKGFNPHPKMGFAQPLSLGYKGLHELMEFETLEEKSPDDIKKSLAELMPEGIEITGCKRADCLPKTLAALTEAAEYRVRIPLDNKIDMSDAEIRETYMGQKAIAVMKRKKKKKEPEETDIKPMIRSIEFMQTAEDDVHDGKMLSEEMQEDKAEALIVKMMLDSGSVSNLSPELVIDSIKTKFGIDTDRSEIDVFREKIYTSFDV